MAGKSEPNLEIFLFENNKKIASFFSDANGDGYGLAILL